MIYDTQEILIIIIILLESIIEISHAAAATPADTEISGLQNQYNFTTFISVSVIVCVLCSIVFFVTGLLCYHYYPKLKQKQCFDVTRPTQDKKMSPPSLTSSQQEQNV